MTHHAGARAIVEPENMIRLTIYDKFLDSFVILDLPQAITALHSLQDAIREITLRRAAPTDDDS